MPSISPNYQGFFSTNFYAILPRCTFAHGAVRHTWPENVPNLSAISEGFVPKISTSKFVTTKFSHRYFLTAYVLHAACKFGEVLHCLFVTVGTTRRGPCHPRDPESAEFDRANNYHFGGPPLYASLPRFRHTRTPKDSGAGQAGLCKSKACNWDRGWDSFFCHLLILGYPSYIATDFAGIPTHHQAAFLVREDPIVCVTAGTVQCVGGFFCGGWWSGPFGVGFPFPPSAYRVVISCHLGPGGGLDVFFSTPIFAPPKATPDPE